MLGCHTPDGVHWPTHEPFPKPKSEPIQPLFVWGKWRVGFLAIRDVGVGEELTWDYGSPPQASG